MDPAALGLGNFYLANLAFEDGHLPITNDLQSPATLFVRSPGESQLVLPRRKASDLEAPLGVRPGVLRRLRRIIRLPDRHVAFRGPSRPRYGPPDPAARMELNRYVGGLARANFNSKDGAQSILRMLNREVDCPLGDAFKNEGSVGKGRDAGHILRKVPGI